MSAVVEVAAPESAAVRRLRALPVSALPVGLSARVRQFSDGMTGHMWWRLQVYPDSVDPVTRPAFGRGVVVDVEWDADSGGYLVYVSGRRSAAYVQGCGLVRVFGAADAVQQAAWEITWELRTQARGW